MNGLAWRMGWRVLACAALVLEATAQADDLNPVTFKQAPSHPPVVLVKDGQPRANICVMPTRLSYALNLAVQELQECIEQTTGAKLPVVKGRVEAPAIVIGDCDEAAREGLVGPKMPIEGFAIKTAADHVFIVGHDGPVGEGTRAVSDGTAWGVLEFIERFVGVRWYWPTEKDGRSIIKSPSLIIEPVSIEDAPVFRKREIWPPCGEPSHGGGQPLTPHQTRLRHGNSWPINLVVHSPNWANVKEYVEGRPEVFQLKSDKTRNFAVLCYGNPKTLQTYLENIDLWLQGKPARLGIVGNAVTVSPNDVELSCYCDDCRRLWDPEGGSLGSASRVMATFVDKLAREVKQRWPDRDITIIFLPYLNYTMAPDGFKFPGNVEVQICGMPGMATYKEPAIRDSEQRNIDRWVEISGRKVQNWHYDCWPAHKTRAAYQYPHVVKDFYQRNRDKVIGSFINGTEDHWPRQHISLYCWMKCLWNPDYDVDAAVDEFCKRMFGPAARTMRELVGMQIDGWEKSRWPGGRFSPKGVYEVSFPRKDVEKMEMLFAKARKEAEGDALATRRLDYYAPAMLDFFKESKDLAERTGFKPLMAQKVGELPKIDGKLDEPVWKDLEANTFVMYKGDAKPKYTTTVRAVWNFDGIVFGFHMDEPTPHLLETKNGGHDNGEIWWDDNIEIFLDVTGKMEGDYYQFIINSKCDYWDSHMKDTTWEARGFKAATHIDKDFWSMEVFLPYSAFKEVAKPGSGTNTFWMGNFTRHRVADSRNANRQEGSVREYTRMNTTGSGTSDNLTDFAEIKFIE
jgi:hypothetical protein